MSETSSSIGSLATALAIAQGKITGARKDSENPFFSSKYADLASVWDACREALSDNGLSVVQTFEPGKPITIKWTVTDKDSGEITAYEVESMELVINTLLLHSSGEWIKSKLVLTPRDATPQSAGSAITYGRRYLLAAIAGIAQVDDDGNDASKTGNRPAQKVAQRVIGPRPDQKKVSMYVTEMVRCATLKDEAGTHQLWDEVKTEEATAKAIWEDLQKNHRTDFQFIRSILKPNESTGEGRRA